MRCGFTSTLVLSSDSEPVPFQISDLFILYQKFISQAGGLLKREFLSIIRGMIIRPEYCDELTASLFNVSCYLHLVSYQKKGTGFKGLRSRNLRCGSRG